MISQKMQDKINEQINAELYSSYLYLSMSAYFEDKNLDGMANWMRVQAQEEMVHVMKFYSYLNDRNGRVLLKAIDAPPTVWDSPLQVFETALGHELKVTVLINGLAELAEKEKDRASIIFLEWFVTEQVEEEASAQAVVDKLRMFGEVPQALYMLDRELAARVFVPPAAGNAA